MTSAFGSDDPLLKARALRAAGELGLVDLHLTTRANLKAKDPVARFWAAWSTGLLDGHKDAVAYLQSLAESGARFRERAVQLAMRRLSQRDAKVWLTKLIKESQQLRTAALSAGACGLPDIVPWLIEKMKVPELARVCGEAFSLITGADIIYDKLEGKKPEGFEAGPTENPEDEDVSMDADLDLVWPDPALIQKWWNARQGNFTKGTRYLLGQPITPESLRLALKNGYQRQCAAAALELAILNPGRPLFRSPALRGSVSKSSSPECSASIGQEERLAGDAVEALVDDLGEHLSVLSLAGHRLALALESDAALGDRAGERLDHRSTGVRPEGRGPSGRNPAAPRNRCAG